MYRVENQASLQLTQIEKNLERTVAVSARVALKMPTPTTG